MSKRDITKKTIYILTEGETEEAYFSRISNYVNDDVVLNYSIKVEVRVISPGDKQDPVGLVREAILEKRDKSYWQVWVVFDKDRKRDEENKKAFNLALKSKIKIAFSSISFEHWLILHFEKNNYAFQRSDCESRGEVCSCNGQICASAYLKQPNLYPDFKKGKSLIYDHLQYKNVFAIENAAWLRHHKSPYNDIYLLNPYTDVDLLLTELVCIPNVEYLSVGGNFNFEGLLVTISGFVRNGNTVSVSLSLHNQKEVSFLMNNLQQFSIVVSERNSFEYTINQSLNIQPGTMKNVVLDFIVNDNSNTLTFKAKTKDKYFLAELITTNQ